MTAPFKADAVDWAHEVAADAGAMGAANTLVPAGAGLAAFNTDAPAVELALREAGARFDGVEALVVGAGGAARAAVHALRSAGARVTCAARRLPAAQGVGAHAAVALADPAYGELRPGIIVHTTPLGTDGVGEAPVPGGMLRAGVFVLDAVYRPRRTSLLRRAAAAGATPMAGSEWFLGQAWLQHLRIFAEAYRGAHGDPVPDAATAAAVRAAMAGALDRWLGSPSPSPSAESTGSAGA